MSKKINLVPLNKALTNAVDGHVLDKPKDMTIFEIDTAKQDPEEPDYNDLTKSILRFFGDPKSPSRIAFTTDPSHHYTSSPLYRSKTWLVPDTILKTIARKDDLISSICRTRANQVSSFGRPRPSRFEKGFILENRREAESKIAAEKDEVKRLQLREDLQRRKDYATRKLMNCGDTSGYFDRDPLTLAQYLYQSTYDAMVVGRIATEVVYKSVHGKKTFHSFRVIDAGTIVKARPQKGEDPTMMNVRKEAKRLLAEINGEKTPRSEGYIAPESFVKDEYAWIQVIEDQVRQAFKADECLVHNFYPVPDIELDGYPVTPIDTAISAIITHMSISTHNRLYFQNGRASRGMLVVTSDDLPKKTIDGMKQQFHAAINGVDRSFRMPVFRVGKEDSIEWQPIDTTGRDMEFQYLSDMNSKVIFAAFQMSPEEIPAWSGLGKGAASQSLGESDGMWKITVARDQGIRPLLEQFEDFLNRAIMPLIDPELSEMVILKLVGLDAETAEKESIRTQQDMPIWMNFNDVREKHDKTPIERSLAGDFFLNPAWQTQLDKYVPVGIILEKCFGIVGASKDPQYAYHRDPFWFQQQASIDAKEAAKQAAAQQPQQPPGGPDQGGGGPDAPPSQSDGNQANEHPNSQPSANPKALKGKDGVDIKQITDGIGKDPSQLDPNLLSQSLDEAMSLLKTEAQLSEKQKRVAAYQSGLVKEVMDGWAADAKLAIEEITGLANKFPTKKKR